MKKAIITTIVSISVILFGIMVYALVYVDQESTFWKNRLVIGISFMVFTALSIIVARRSRTAC
jgi:D-alanyl-lipoteichoic acid acyltransferase DltB (MBOAT superfamily)